MTCLGEVGGGLEDDEGIGGDDRRRDVCVWESGVIPTAVYVGSYHSDRYKFREVNDVCNSSSHHLSLYYTP